MTNIHNEDGRCVGSISKGQLAQWSFQYLVKAVIQITSIREARTSTLTLMWKHNLLSHTHTCLEQNLPWDIWCTQASEEIHIFDKSVNTAGEMSSQISHAAWLLTFGWVLIQPSSELQSDWQKAQQTTSMSTGIYNTCLHLSLPASSVNTHWYDSLPGVFARFKAQPQVKSCSKGVQRQREQKNKRASCIARELIKVKQVLTMIQTT